MSRRFTVLSRGAVHSAQLTGGGVWCLDFLTRRIAEFNYVGVLIVCGALLADSLIGSVQEEILKNRCEPVILVHRTLHPLNCGPRT